MIGTKLCHGCNRLLPFTEFHKNSAKKDGLQSQCKNCMSKLNKTYYATHASEYKAIRRKYYDTHKDHLQAKQEEWRQNNIEHVKQVQRLYQQTHKEQHNAWKREWRRRPENKARLAAYARRMRANPVAYEKYRLRKLVRQTMGKKGQNRSAILPPIVGCSCLELYTHLLQSWEKNYGCKYEGQDFHIDHIIPLSLAHDIEIVHQLFHHTNLQLLTPSDNMKKGACLQYDA